MGAGGSVATEPETKDLIPRRPPQLQITVEWLHRLAVDAGGAFTEALERLALQEQSRWDQEFQKLEEAALKLEQLRAKLVADRERFEEEKRRFGPGGTEKSDMIDLNIGGVATVSVGRATLTQCEGSMLAAAFSGQWELPTDRDGRVFIDFTPELFLPLVDELRARRIESLGASPPPPSPMQDPKLDEQFTDMLKHFGLLDWFYRQEPVQHQVHIGGYTYSVIPAESPDRAVALTDMAGTEIIVPRGWEVLSTTSTGVTRVIEELTQRKWGAGLLLVRDAEFGDEGEQGYGFVGYRTQLSGSGAAGTRFEHPMRWFADVSEDRRRLLFSGSSYRLVLRARDVQQSSHFTHTKKARTAQRSPMTGT